MKKNKLEELINKFGKAKDGMEEVVITLKLNGEYQSQVSSSIIVTTKTGETYNIGNITLYKE